MQGEEHREIYRLASGSLALLCLDEELELHNPSDLPLCDLMHCYIKCPFLSLGASFGQFSSNGISFHHELVFAMGLEF